jgi:hypothetical protein
MGAGSVIWIEFKYTTIPALKHGLNGFFPKKSERKNSIPGSIQLMLQGNHRFPRSGL